MSLHPDLIEFLFENWVTHDWRVEAPAILFSDGKGAGSDMRCNRCECAIDPTAAIGAEWRRWQPMQPCTILLAHGDMPTELVPVSLGNP